MRKFTKEIASLLATVTMTLSVNTGYASSEEAVKMSGEIAGPDIITDTPPEELVPTAGVVMISDDDLPQTTTTTGSPSMIGTTIAKKSTTTTTTTTTGLIGTTTARLDTTTTVPSMIGTTVTPAKITTTASPTITTTMIGTTVATEDITVTTPTEPEFPPLAGMMALPDGDANCDGDTDMSDAVLVMQALANPNKYGIDGTAENHLTVNGKYNADMDGDGLTVGDAQAIQKKLLGVE